MKDHVAIIVHDQDKVLFVKRSEHKTTLPNIWAFPSGTREDKESVQDTVLREAMEELGVKVKVGRTLATKDLPEFSVRLHFITCSIIDGTPYIREPREFSQIEWLTFSEFFDKYDDTQIGHGLIYLRENPLIWQ